VPSGVSVAKPTMIYGTAWKEEASERLTAMALEAGFRAIDTANQRKHYHEEGVGRAVSAALARGTVRREELFLQTKFTFKDGQDHRLPYDPRAPIAKQVEQSMASSLAHFGIERFDSYLLHGPSRREGLGRDDWEAWSAMEAEQRAGRTRAIGISNVSARQLEEILARAAVKPTYVQNRTFTRPQADAAVRELCTRYGILYEGFSLLTANPAALRHPAVRQIAEKHAKTTEQIVLRHAVQAGIVPLTGTTSRKHMDDDLDVGRFSLEAVEAEAVRKLLL